MKKIAIFFIALILTFAILPCSADVVTSVAPTAPDAPTTVPATDPIAPDTPVSSAPADGAVSDSQVTIAPAGDLSSADQIADAEDTVIAPDAGIPEPPTSGEAVADGSAGTADDLLAGTTISTGAAPEIAPSEDTAEDDKKVVSTIVDEDGNIILIMEDGTTMNGGKAEEIIPESEGNREFKFEPQNFVANLGYMGAGMLGIFIVIGIIILATVLLNKLFREKATKSE